MVAKNGMSEIGRAPTPGTPHERGVIPPILGAIVRIKTVKLSVGETVRRMMPDGVGLKKQTMTPEGGGTMGNVMRGCRGEEKKITAETTANGLETA